jgi:hypothetical protein
MNNIYIRVVRQGGRYHGEASPQRVIAQKSVVAGP